MRRKLFVSYLIIIGLVLAISSGTFWFKGYDFIEQEGQRFYLMQARMLGDAFQDEEFTSKDEYEGFIKEYGDKYDLRITLIDRDGTVVADTVGEYLENHKTREEVGKALQGESNTVTRYSKTMGQKYSYSAVPVNNDSFQGVIRVSVPLGELTTLEGNLASGVAAALFLSLILAGVVAFLYSKYIARPIDEITAAAEKVSLGDYSIKIYTNETDQIGRLAVSFNAMTKNLRNTVDTLTQRNMELEAMLSSMDSGVVAIDEGNLILFNNQAFAGICEIQDGVVTGKSLYSVIRSSIIFKLLDAVKKSNKTEKGEGVINVSANRLVRVTATPVNITGGNTIGFLLILDDITQMRKLENMRSDFVSNVTHELKTPLTSIRGFIDTLKHGAIEDKAVSYKFLDIIDVEAERLYGLIQDILLLSEIESKKDQEMFTCRVDNTIAEVIDLLRGKVPESVRIIYEKNNNIRPYICNPDRMKQLIINLLDNAIKYTEQGSITITCKEENNRLVIGVTDTGVGMTEEHLSRIFERFYRVDKGRSRKQGGTGLGLSIVKHIVELYDGSIRLESKENVGTSFEIRFPY